MKKSVYYLTVFIVILSSCGGDDPRYQWGQDLGSIDSIYPRTQRPWNYFKGMNEYVYVHDSSFFSSDASTYIEDSILFKQFMKDERIATINQPVFIDFDGFTTLLGKDDAEGKEGLMIKHGLIGAELIDVAFFRRGNEYTVKHFLKLGGRWSDYAPKMNMANYKNPGLVILHGGEYFNFGRPDTMRKELTAGAFTRCLEEVKGENENQCMFIPMDMIQRLMDEAKNGTYQKGVFFSRAYFRKYGYLDIAWLEPAAPDDNYKIRPLFLGGAVCPCIPCCD